MDYVGQDYCAFELSSLKRMTLSICNLRFQIRNLEFHGTLVLNTALLYQFIPLLTNLEFLGMFLIIPLPAIHPPQNILGS